jgi:hypothetical protein
LDSTFFSQEIVLEFEGWLYTLIYYYIKDDAFSAMPVSVTYEEHFWANRELTWLNAYRSLAGNKH